MKFKSITLCNFMRYKGENRIEFACDKDKNVTIVLGDNTVGKTTLAQAFRWGLYGVIKTEKGKGKSDYTLLNKDVIAEMDENSRASVWVEIVIENNDKTYKVKRECAYNRRYPTLNISESYKRIKLDWYDKDGAEYKVEKEEDIKAIINSMFPVDLSAYFLFDGEHWSEAGNVGLTNSVKDSVYVLTGLQTTKNAMYHLKDMGATSVIGKFSRNIKGGAIYDNISEDIEKIERRLHKLEESIELSKTNIVNYNKKIQEIEEFLEENKNTEELQKHLKSLKKYYVEKEKLKDANYKTFLNIFSDKAYMVIAAPMIRKCETMLKNANIQRRDIPYMRQASIDYLLRRGVCLCGNKIEKDSKELDCLMEQRNYLPPADLGSLLGDFEKSASRWKSKSEDAISELENIAMLVSDANEEMEETFNNIVKTKQNMSADIDFKEKYGEIKRYENEINKLNRSIGSCEREIEMSKEEIDRKEGEREKLRLQNKENEKWNERLKIAQAIYEDLEKGYVEREKEVYNALNEKIKNKFAEMFNAKDKKIQIDKNYNVQMMYKLGGVYVEEKNLSEGEKVARNFAFVASVMEYSKELKKSGSKDADTLPIVLDGPFSKLGSENISLVAGAIPKIAEQVIIFMLDKDWEYTKLDDVVGRRYYIEKPEDKGFARIVSREEN